MYQLYGEGGAWIPNKPINRGRLDGYRDPRGAGAGAGGAPPSGPLGASASGTTATTNTPAGGRSEPSNIDGPPGAGAGAGGASYYGPLAAVDSPLVSDQVNNHARPWFTRGDVGQDLRMYLDWQHVHVAGNDISAEDLAEDLDFSEMFAGLPE